MHVYVHDTRGRHGSTSFYVAELSFFFSSHSRIGHENIIILVQGVHVVCGQDSVHDNCATPRRDCQCIPQRITSFLLYKNIMHKMKRNCSYYFKIIFNMWLVRATDNAELSRVFTTWGKNVLMRESQRNDVIPPRPQFPIKGFWSMQETGTAESNTRGGGLEAMGEAEREKRGKGGKWMGNRRAQYKDVVSCPNRCKNY